MKIFCFTILLCGWIFTVFGSENLVENGNFDVDVKGWQGYRLVAGEDGKAKTVGAPEFVSFCADDGVGDKKGCLKVDFSKVNSLCVPWRSGALLTLKKNIPKNTEVTITFYAKSINGSRRLSIMRPSGGGGAGSVMMSDKWQKFSLKFKSKWNTPMFYFVIIDHYGRKGRLEEGEFLLDNIEVIIKK